MKTIHKYTIELPSGAEILTCQFQRGNLCLWALVNPDAPLETRIIRVYGTGHPVKADIVQRYIGTVQDRAGYLVWHVFEELT